MKKYLYSIVLATLILMSATVVNASNEVYYINKENVEMTEKEYNNLLGLGFSERYIEGMNQEEFLNNKDLEGSVLSENQKYLRRTTTMRNGIKITTVEEITKEEAMRDKELQSQKGFDKGGAAGNYYDGLISTSTLVITTKIAGISKKYMRYLIDVEWITMPTDRYNDIIGVGLESAKVQIASNIAFREEWVTGGGTHSNTTICSPIYTNTGGLAIFGLPSGSLQSLYVTFYYNVSKKSGVGTITSLYAGGNYAHATGNVSASTLASHVSISNSGIIVDYPYSTSYQFISPATASFIGTW